MTALPGPQEGTQLTDDYLATLGKLAYLWGWPLVNMHNRRTILQQLPEPGLLGGIIPVGPPGTFGMLRDYIRPEERLVACPNQDVVYGFGLLASDLGPVVVQVPDFGDRFWVYQVVDQRTDSFAQLGAMYGSKPGHYLLAPQSWEGETPDGILGVFRYDTVVGAVIPRLFMDDTAADREAVQPLVNQMSMYPLAQYDGTIKHTDWAAAPTFDAGGSTGGEHETQWVNPDVFFEQLGTVLDEVPARSGEEALYAWFRSLVSAASADPGIAEKLKAVARDADSGLVAELFQFRNIGLPSANNWTTQRNGARFGTDYLSRTAMGKANIFVNSPNETAYYYQDLDDDGERLDGSSTYAVTFAAGEIPPVRGFWSLTVYGENHFFYANDLDRFSLGTKNKDLHVADDGSLTLTAGGPEPTDPEALANWLPAPAGPFSLYLRAYWPDDVIADQHWTPPRVTRV